MSYSLDYFKTSKNVSVEIIEKEYSLPKLNTSKKSILEYFKADIDEYITKNKLKNDIDNFKKINILKIINDNYFLEFVNNNKIEYFCKNIISEKYEIMAMNKRIENFFKLNMNRNINEDIIFYNPINHKNIDSMVLKKILTDNDNNNDNNNDNINKTLDILLHGNIINLSLPSIGIIKLNISKKKDGVYENYVNFIKKIINYPDNSYNIIEYIPLTDLDISETLTNILLNNTTNININNINNLINMNNINNSKTKILIKKIIDSVKNNIKTDKIFLHRINNKKSKVKQEYLIPYIINNKGGIEMMKKNDIETKCNTGDFNVVHNSNKDLIIYVIKNIYINKNNLNNDFKNIMACFLFYIINVVCDICKEYINNIDNLLKQLIDSTEKRFRLLNIEEAFLYTSKLNKSLNKFKLILLNNFYQLFLPSKISEFYGMHQNNDGCYVPQQSSIFTMNDEYIIDNYPFTTEFPLSETENVDIKICNFILQNYEYDVYDKKKILDIGGLVFDQDIMTESIKILNDYYTFLQKNNNFTLFIIDKIQYYFNVKKNIPYELLSDFQSSDLSTLIKNRNLTPQNEKILKDKLLLKFKTYLERSTKYYLKIIDIREIIKSQKKYNFDKLYNLEEIYLLSFNIYLTRGLCLIPIVSNMINNINVKNFLLEEFLKIKKLNENIILKYYNK